LPAILSTLSPAADEYIYVEDLVSTTKELVHYLAF
jgi:hypothetical protein